MHVHFTVDMLGHPAYIAKVQVGRVVSISFGQTRLEAIQKGLSQIFRAF